MKRINKYIVERLHINKDTGNHDHHYNYHPTTKDELKKLINKLVKERGKDADLNDIDTSEITDMSELFYYSEFNGEISDWDVSNVKNMYALFYNSDFTGENGDISKWDVSNVKYMNSMFMKSKFNGDISNWDVSNDTYMDYMFLKSPLEKNPPKWYKK